MATIKKQYYGIKFPFTSNNLNGFFIDLNNEYKDKIASEIAHVLLTTKRTRLREPEFGTNLINFIFEQNDDVTWDSVMEEAKESVSRYVSGAELTEMKVISSAENPNDIFLDIRYTTKKGMKTENNRLVVKL